MAGLVALVSLMQGLRLEAATHFGRAISFASTGASLLVVWALLTHTGRIMLAQEKQAYKDE